MKNIEEYTKQFGINQQTYELIFKNDDNLPRSKQGSYKELIADTTIKEFTKIDEKKFLTKILKLLRSHTLIDLKKINFNETLKKYEYNNFGEIITFDKISNYLENETDIKELTSNKRSGLCHLRSIHLTLDLESSKLLTGYITIGKKRVLHSVVEYPKNGEKLILDWTRNIIITKEQYLKLTEFQEINSIKREDLSNDIKLINGNLDNLSIKLYLVCREAVIRDIERNKQLFINNQSLTHKSKLKVKRP